jgi:transposase-like protein
MVYSPFRNAISHAPRTHKPTPDDPCVAPGSRGRPHSDAKVEQVRRLIETTTYSYGQIAKRTGVPAPTISRWMVHRKWPRPAFAPRSTDTVPRWRASIRLRRRTLGARLLALSERWVRELEAQPGVDFAKLREALELLKLTKIATLPKYPRHRIADAAASLSTAAARERVIADLRAKGVDIARTPSEALADFVESCAPGPDPNKDPALKVRGRYSKRVREHARMLERG